MSSATKNFCPHGVTRSNSETNSNNLQQQSSSSNAYNHPLRAMMTSILMEDFPSYPPLEISSNQSTTTASSTQVHKLMNSHVIPLPTLLLYRKVHLSRTRRTDKTLLTRLIDRIPISDEEKHGSHHFHPSPWSHSASRSFSQAYERSNTNPLFDGGTSDWRSVPCNPNHPVSSFRPNGLGSYHQEKSFCSVDGRERESLSLSRQGSRSCSSAVLQHQHHALLSYLSDQLDGGRRLDDDDPYCSSGSSSGRVDNNNASTANLQKQHSLLQSWWTSRQNGGSLESWLMSSFDSEPVFRTFQSHEDRNNNPIDRIHSSDSSLDMRSHRPALYPDHPHHAHHPVSATVSSPGDSFDATADQKLLLPRYVAAFELSNMGVNQSDVVAASLFPRILPFGHPNYFDFLKSLPHNEFVYLARSVARYRRSSLLYPTPSTIVSINLCGCCSPHPAPVLGQKFQDTFWDHRQPDNCHQHGVLDTSLSLMLLELHPDLDVVEFLDRRLPAIIRQQVGNRLDRNFVVQIFGISFMRFHLLNVWAVGNLPECTAADLGRLQAHPLYHHMLCDISNRQEVPIFRNLNLCRIQSNAAIRSTLPLQHSHDTSSTTLPDSPSKTFSGFSSPDREVSGHLNRHTHMIDV